MSELMEGDLFRVEVDVPLNFNGLHLLRPDAGVQHGHNGGVCAVIRAKCFYPVPLLVGDLPMTAHRAGVRLG